MLKLAGGTWAEEFRFTFQKLGLLENIIGRTVRFSCAYSAECHILGGSETGESHDTFDGIVRGFELCSGGNLRLFVIKTNSREAVTLTYGLEHNAGGGWCIEGFRWCEGRGTTDDPESFVTNFSASVEVLTD